MESASKSPPSEFRASPSSEPMYNVPLSQLSEDVPVQAAAVDSLATSILAVGQLHPIAIAQDGRIIDGFHRVAALKRLSYGTALAVVHECDEADFWSRRITEALRHGEIRQERVVTWMNTLYQQTEFVATWDSLVHALSVWWGWLGRGKLPPGLGPQKTAQPGSNRDRRQRAKREGVEQLGSVLDAFNQWLAVQSRRWGLSSATVKRYIGDAHRGYSKAETARKLRRRSQGVTRRGTRINARTRPLYQNMPKWINTKRRLLFAVSPPQSFDSALRNFRTAIDEYFARGEATSG